MSDATQIEAAIVDAAARRNSRGVGVSTDTTAYRLVHGSADGLSGLAIDRLGSVAVVRLRSSVWRTEAAVDAVANACVAVGCSAVHVIVDEPAKHQQRELGDLEASLNARLASAGLAAPATPFVIRESGWTFEVSVHEGFSQGLFLDMRPIRRDLAARWSGRRVANLFAYTCAFGVALGRTNDVVNVDVSAKYLDQGRRNYRLNELPAPDSAFVRRDAFAFVELGVKKGAQWDAVVLDPPVFSRGKKGRSRPFSLGRDLDGLVGGALDLLAPGGELFVSTNLAAMGHDEFASRVQVEARRRGRRIVQQWSPAPDYPVAVDAWHLKTALVA
jgi:23S rRNA (cytosine1962-C5)-methyltransferase